MPPLNYDLYGYVSHSFADFLTSPEGSFMYENESSNGIELLYEHILLLRNKFPDCLLFLAGDFNARTKDLQDFIFNDSLGFIFGNVPYCNDSFDPLVFPRKYRDQKYQSFGISLVEMCSVLDIHILNGRVCQDREGHITCVSGNGSSVVDYCIASSELFPFIADFEVLNNSKSNHFPLTCTLKLPVTDNFRMNKMQMDKNVRYDNAKPYTTLNKFYWNENNREKFVSLFNLKFIFSYDDIIYLIDTNMNKTISILNDLYTSTAVELKMKYKSKPLHLEYCQAKVQPPWWDNEIKI